MVEAVAVKSRPILFSAPMVQAILDGKKTQTRRIVKPQPAEWQWIHSFEDGTFARVGEDFESNPFTCRLGSAGDQLWVKHPTRITGRSANGFRVADKGFPDANLDRFFYWHEFEHKVPAEGRGFGRALPRVLSRLTLDIVKVRAERLQEISGADAAAEGVARPWPGGAWPWISRIETPWRSPGQADAAPRFLFKHLWETLNGKGSWAANPWVWVIEFEVRK